MTPTQLFRKEFTFRNLLKVYSENISFSANTGVDGISKVAFEKELTKNLREIQQLVLSGVYKYRPYKAKLVLRSYTKPPRIVESPTIRDKVVLRCIYNILATIFNEDLRERELHSQVRAMITSYNSGAYDYILRFDIKNYYPSIDHTLLIEKIKQKTKNKLLLFLIISAIENQNDLMRKNNKPLRDIGIPQGISISNILANVYFFDTDLHFKSLEPEIQYSRYVDDVLILLKEPNVATIEQLFLSRCKKLKLEPHDKDKIVRQKIHLKFDFLGYEFNSNIIGVRKASIDALREKIIRMCSVFAHAKNQDTERFIFRINLKITGCIFNQKKYGWLFYFSQLTDLSILHSLDHFVSIQLRRVQITDNTSIKRFAKSWYHIQYNLRKTNYIQVFDNYTKRNKEKLLFLYNIKFSDETIDFEFSRLISKEIKELEKDLGRLS